MVDINQLRGLVVRPTLNHIGLYSKAAENLIVGTGLTESKLEALRQYGNGPAIGFFQMEPFTHDDCWANFLKYKPELAEKIHQLCLPFFMEDSREMAGNLYYAAAMCRIKYYRAPDALPDADDWRNMAWYWKHHYNTGLGAGTVDKALSNFKLACS